MVLSVEVCLIHLKGGLCVRYFLVPSFGFVNVHKQ